MRQLTGISVKLRISTSNPPRLRDSPLNGPARSATMREGRGAKGVEKFLRVPRGRPERPRKLSWTTSNFSGLRASPLASAFNRRDGFPWLGNGRPWNIDRAVYYSRLFSIDTPNPARAGHGVYLLRPRGMLFLMNAPRMLA